MRPAEAERIFVRRIFLAATQSGALGAHNGGELRVSKLTALLARCDALWRRSGPGRTLGK